MTIDGYSLSTLGDFVGQELGVSDWITVDQARINQFFDSHQSGYQSGLALKAFARGGLAGVGPGAGIVKYHLPDAHSDFIFAVAGEEFGVLVCGLIVILFCTLAVRILLCSARVGDAFSGLAGAGQRSSVYR